MLFENLIILQGRMEKAAAGKKKKKPAQPEEESKPIDWGKVLALAAGAGGLGLGGWALSRSGKALDTANLANDNAVNAAGMASASLPSPKAVKEIIQSTGTESPTAAQFADALSSRGQSFLDAINLARAGAGEMPLSSPAMEPAGV